MSFERMLQNIGLLKSKSKETLHLTTNMKRMCQRIGTSSTL